MKKIYTTVIGLLLGLGAFSQSNVTFQVDMNQYTGTFTTPEVNGTFNGWCGNCNAMSDANSDGIWEVTLPLSDDSIEYKFAHDNWTGQETLTPGSACTKTTGSFTNRFIHISGDTTLPAVCWQSCDVCGSLPEPVMVTLLVDFSLEAVCSPPDSVDVTGAGDAFGNWGSSPITMTDANADDVYEVTLELLTNTYYEYKFRSQVNGGTKWESSANRSFTLTSASDTTIDVVCFSDNGPCSGVAYGNTTVTFAVDMTNEVPGDTIWVIGSFTDPQWQAGAIPLTYSGTGGVYEATTTVCANSFQYKFVNGDANTQANEEFDGDTTAASLPCISPNGLGGYNREYTRTNSDPIVIAYIFGTCDTFVHSPAGLEEQMNFNVAVFPNPFTGSFNVASTNLISSLIISDLSGRTVARVSGMNKSSLTVDAQALGLTSGLYIVTVKDVNNAEITLKISAQ